MGRVSEETSALARILNLLMLAAGAVLFVAALADPRIPRPQGGMSWLFWFGGPAAVAMLALCGWGEWYERYGCDHVYEPVRISTGEQVAKICSCGKAKLDRQWLSGHYRETPAGP